MNSKIILLALSFFTTVFAASGCIWDDWGCTGHQTELEGDCVCMGEYAYPGCELSFQEAFGDSLVFDSVISSNVARPWGDLKLTYLPNFGKYFAISDPDLSEPVWVDCRGLNFGDVPLIPLTNHYRDTTGVIRPFQLDGYLSYDLDSGWVDMLYYSAGWRVRYAIER